MVNVCCEDGGKSSHGVVHMQKISSLFSVSADGQRLPLAESSQKDGNDIGFTLTELTGTVDVCQSQGDGRDRCHFTEAADVALPGGFTDAIGGDWSQRCFFVTGCSTFSVTGAS